MPLGIPTPDFPKSCNLQKSLYMLPFSWQVFPDGGQEYPGRCRAWRKVTLVKQTIPEQIATLTDKVVGGASRITKPGGVLAGILFLALLHDPVPVLGAPLPVSYRVTLAWNPSPTTNVAGYRVYYGTASRVYTNSVDFVTGTNATLTGLAAGTTYYFAATAVDANGEESPFSNETSYTTGVPAVGVRGASAGRLVLSVSGLIGQTYAIEASQDLAAWTVIGTVTLNAGGSLDFTDTNAANFSRRFYRTHETPRKDSPGRLTR